MTIQYLHYALVIAEAGSFSRASEQLYISQPSLSNAIAELERELGIAMGLSRVCQSLLQSLVGICYQKPASDGAIWTIRSALAMAGSP